MQQQILTISQLNYAVKQRLEAEFGYIWLIGEISNFSQPVSGHWYLTLKDQQAQVRCAMFRMKNMRVNFPVRNGLQVLVRASVSLYEPRGDYQVIIDTMQPAGDGLLQQQFEQLKMKLAGEGLFAQQHKKAIPHNIKQVGIITSSSGAALQDILHILARRDPSLAVVIYPTQVQGKEATSEIVRMIQLANSRQECDVLIVGRGGGSLEDLWCFNEEAVARAIFHSQIPIISAVGHETDITIADFVADLRAATPSAAAELVSRDQQELYRQLQHQLDRASFAFDQLFGEKQRYFRHLQVRLNAQHPARQLEHHRQIAVQLQQRAERAVGRFVVQQQYRLNQLEQRLTNQHPQRQLQRQQQQLVLTNQRLMQQIGRILQSNQQRYQILAQRLQRNPLPHQLNRHKQHLERISQRLGYALDKKWQLSQQAFQQQCLKLEGLSPLKILARGYSVTQNEQGRALISSQQVNVEELITTRLANGRIISQVLRVEQG